MSNFWIINFRNYFSPINVIFPSIFLSGGYKSSSSNTTSNSRPPGSTATSGSSESSTSSNASNAHRNRNLLDSYHDFAMQIFGSNHGQEVEIQFLHAVENGDEERVENLLKRRSHEVCFGLSFTVQFKETVE